MSTCNRLDLQTLESQPIMLRNLPDHCIRHSAFRSSASPAKTLSPRLPKLDYRVLAFGSDMNFPVFIKAAKMCASMFINDQHEADQQLQPINENLSSTTPNGNSNGHCNGAGEAKVCEQSR